MDKSTARKCAMKLVYEWEMGGDGGADTCVNLLEIEPDEPETEFMNKLLEGVQSNTDAIDEKISEFANGWSMNRLAKVDLAILRIATYEIMFKITPTAIAVNEAVELAKQYSTDRAGGFVNGVLGNLARSLS